jgi:hypothetical protein
MPKEKKIATPTRSIKHVQPIQYILGSMRMNDVQQHSDPVTMRSINQLLQLLRGSTPTGGSKEVGNLVTETGVVGVLHDGHELDGVVAQVSDAGEDVFGEFGVSGDTTFG